VVVADADDLDDPVQQTVVDGHDGGLKLDGRRFPLGVGGVGVGDVPLGATVDPRVQPVRPNRFDDGRCGIGRDRSFVDDAHIGEHDDPAVEGGHRPPHLERLDQHAHAARRPSARDREEHAALV
jgi:hypothetical protein